MLHGPHLQFTHTLATLKLLLTGLKPSVAGDSHTAPLSSSWLIIALACFSSWKKKCLLKKRIPKPVVINLVSLAVCMHFRLTLRTGRYQRGGIYHATEEGLTWAVEYVSGCVEQKLIPSLTRSIMALGTLESSSTNRGDSAEHSVLCLGAKCLPYV